MVRTDVTKVVNGVTYTLRTWTNNGMFYRGDLFVGGWCRGRYKTAAGMNRAFARLTTA